MSAWGPPWLDWMLNEMHEREVPGVVDNPRIVWYHGFTAAGEAPDEIPWCSSGQCAAFESVGIRSTRSKAASSWLRWGSASLLRLGATLVFRRVGGSGYHVASCAGWNNLYVLALGANQGNGWSVVRRKREDLVDVRWPSGYVWP